MLTAPTFWLPTELARYTGTFLALPMAPLTIHSKHVPDLLLDHPQCSLDAIGAGHRVDVIGIEAAQVQNLGKKVGLSGRAWPSAPFHCHDPP